MKSKKRNALSATRVAAWVTSILLIVGGVICISLYDSSLYQPLLLLGILQIFPAVVNLILFLPILKKREQPAAAVPPAPPIERMAADAADDAAEEAEETKPAEPFGTVLKRRTKEIAVKTGRWLYDFWVERRNVVVAGLILITLAIFGVRYWSTYSEQALPGLLDYLVPVLLVVLFVLYIVLDKWCKHTSAGVHEPTEGEEPTDAQRAAIFDRAVLHSLRGALSVARLAIVITAAVIMLRKLSLVYWDEAAGVVITVLFYYQLVFLLISLAVRMIRREISTSPELSIPMPGLGGEDLGILAYLEKNTGITMRSLWSIRLAGKIVPYAGIAAVLLIWGASGIVKIEANQQGAHYRLGVLQEEALEPGLHMTLPWPFDSVEVYDTEVVNQVTVGYISEERGDNIWTQAHGIEEYCLLLGNGHELVSINMRVEFVIDDLYTYLTGSAAPESLMQAAAYELITAKTIGTDLATLLTADRITFTENFKNELAEHTAEYKTGLRIVNVVLESIHPPVEVSDIYQEIVNKKIEAQQIVSTAMGEANVVIIQANMNKDATVKDAQTQQSAAIAAAQAEVAEILGHSAAYAEHGKAYEYYLRINAWREAYSKGNLIIDGVGLSTDEINTILVLLGVLSSK